MKNETEDLPTICDPIHVPEPVHGATLVLLLIGGYIAVICFLTWWLT